MFNRIRTGWVLTKQSLSVLEHDKELLLFPLMSGISLVVVSASFIVPFFISDSLRQTLQTDSSGRDFLVCTIVFLFYFINYFVIMFFNAALIGCARIRFEGGNPTLDDGFRIGIDRLPQIFGWALISATVGMILKILESSSDKAGQIIYAVLGLAWTITTYFVLPILVVEKTGPIAAFKHSTNILKNTWGEALTANIGISMIIFGAGILAFIPAILGIVIGTTASVITGIAITVLCFILLSLISSAAQTIITVALYEYAANHRAPREFDQQLLEQAFTPKGR